MSSSSDQHLNAKDMTESRKVLCTIRLSVYNHKTLVLMTWPTEPDLSFGEQKKLTAYNLNQVECFRTRSSVCLEDESWVMLNEGRPKNIGIGTCHRGSRDKTPRER